MRPAIGLTVGVVSALFVVDMLGVYAAYLKDKRELVAELASINNAHADIQEAILERADEDYQYYRQKYKHLLERGR